MRTKSAILAAWLLATATVFGQEDPRNNCGNENQRACNSSDFLYRNIHFGSTSKCDSDLKEVGGICVTDKRHTLQKTGGWLGFALAEQRYAIGLDEPINRLTWLGAHNSFSSVVQGFNSPIYTNQYYSITDQLQWGVRHLELDPQFYGYSTNKISRLCHSGTEALCALPTYDSRPFSFALSEIRQWLDANPGEVVILKMDDKNAFVPDMINDLEKMLGPKIFRRPLVFQGWPRMREILDSGKQVLIMQHGLDPLPGTTATWAAKDLIQTNNWPKNQNFNTCTGNDGLTVANRNLDAWWDIAEGRSGSNADDPLFGIVKSTGLVGVPQLIAAQRCGVSIIGLDFINALNSSYSAYPSDSPDDRNRAHIWSWAENDFGGYAAFNPATRRWYSRPSTEAKRFICTPARAPGTKTYQRNWKLTSGSFIWSEGMTACAVFNANGVTYVPAFPATALQNEELGAFLNGQGVREEVWLGYASNQRLQYSYSPGEVVFVTTPGVAPAPQDITFNSSPGALVNVNQPAGNLKISASLLSNTIPDTGSVTLRLTPQTPVPLPGKYVSTATINASIPGVLSAAAPVKITYYVQAPTSLTLSTAQTTITADTPVRFKTTLATTLNFVNDGKITLVRTSDPNSEPVPAVAQPNVTFDLGFLPVGVHTFQAEYSGTDIYQPATSATLTITVLPKITVNPASLSFSMQRAAAPPSSQKFLISDILPASAAIVPSGSCSWLQTNSLPDPSGLVVIVVPTAAASNLSAGSHTCTLTISDAQSSQFGSAIVTAVMNVRTTMQLIPSSLSFLVGQDSVSAKVSVGTPGNDPIPGSVSSNCPEISATAHNGNVVPDDFTVLAARLSKAPGLYNCTVTFSSPLAPSVQLPVSYQVVNPTVVNSNPGGLTFVVDNTPYAGEAKFIWAPGTSHQVTTDTIQLDGSDTRYRFANWSDGQPQGHTVIANQNGGSYTVTYSPEYRLSADAVPSNGGTLRVSPLSTYYTPGSIVSLTATPANGYNFLGWSGSLSGTNPSQQLTMNAPKAVSAGFVNQATSLVTIESDAPGTQIQVDGGSPIALPVTLNLVQGRKYRFAAPPTVNSSAGVQWQFNSWVGLSPNIVADYTIPTSASTLTIRYRKYVLFNVTANPPAAGTIINAGWQFANGTIPVSATPAAGFRFVGWSGELSGSTNPIDVSALNPLNAVANFAPTTLPAVFANSAAARSNGTEPGTRIVPIDLRNLGPGPAFGTVITGIGNIRVVTGTGTVSVVTPLPVDYGDLNAGVSASRPLLFAWPETATRVSFTVQFTANNGAYSGSTTLTIYR